MFDSLDGVQMQHTLIATCLVITLQCVVGLCYWFLKAYAVNDTKQVKGGLVREQQCDIVKHPQTGNAGGLRSYPPWETSARSSQSGSEGESPQGRLTTKLSMKYPGSKRAFSNVSTATGGGSSYASSKSLLQPQRRLPGHNIQQKSWVSLADLRGQQVPSLEGRGVASASSRCGSCSSEGSMRVRISKAKPRPVHLNCTKSRVSSTDLLATAS
mmetsp:Transcript_8091/g.18943  ORF Transcript_8091/g.18943 Transcript_8091/m.18943 type:complete len:213 (-) Transcript_8091:214-852(-)